MEYTVDGVLYSGKFSPGNRVKVGEYGSVCRVVGPDKFLTQVLGKLHYELIDEGYLLGKYKTICAEPAREDELALVGDDPVARQKINERWGDVFDVPGLYMGEE